MMLLKEFIVTQTPAPTLEPACEWLSVTATNVLNSMVISALIPWLSVMKCKIKMQPIECVRQDRTQVGQPWRLCLKCPPVHLLSHRCATLWQRPVGMQLVWLWWTRLWMSCRVDASALCSSLRVCSRRPQTVLWVCTCNTCTNYCTLFWSVLKETCLSLSLYMNVDLHCLCLGFYGRFKGFKHKYRNVPFASPLLPRQDHAGVPGKKKPCFSCSYGHKSWAVIW